MKSANLTTNSPLRTRAAAAEHIAVEASRLVRIAKENDFPLLAYLIDMAVLEAWREASERGQAPGAGEESHPAQDSG